MFKIIIKPWRNFNWFISRNVRTKSYLNVGWSLHLITTSRNLFQSAGLNRLRHMARPLISFIIVLLIENSSSYFFSLGDRVTSSRHFSIRL